MRSLILCLLLLPLALYGTWSTSADQNTPVAVTTGDQIQPKIVTASDGTYYVSWFDTRDGGNYDLYLQHFDALGTPLWTVNGIAVSTHPTMTWTTDYDLCADAAGGAVASFQDIRHDETNEQNDIFTYRIGPDQSFAWGADGLTLSNNEDLEAAPVITLTPSGYTVIAWPRMGTPYTIMMQRIAPDGTLAWGTDGITLSGTESYNTPRIVSSEGEDVIVGFFKQTGNFPAVTKNLWTRRISETGTTVWETQITTQAHIAYFHNFNMSTAADGGAALAWNDDRDTNNFEDAWVQIVNADGSIRFPAGGAQCSTNSAMNRYYPNLVSANGCVFCYWVEKNGNQDQAGLYGQNFGLNGSRQWGDTGQAIVNLSATDIYAPAVVSNGFDSMVLYMDTSFGNTTDARVKAIRVDGDGVMAWQDRISVLCNVQSSKDDLVTTGYANGQVVAAWMDGRDDGGSIYAQNVSWDDGSLGPVSVTPSVSIIEPEENDTIHLLPISIVCSVDNFTPGADGQLLYSLDGTAFPLTNDVMYSMDIELLSEGNHTISVELVNMNGQSLNPPVTDDVVITFTAPVLTITSPAEGAVVQTLPLDGSFTVTDMDTYQARISLNGVFVAYSSTGSFSLPTLAEGENTILLELADANQNLVVPAVIDVVTFTYQPVSVDDQTGAYSGPLAIIGTVGNPSSTPGVTFAIGKGANVDIAIYNLRGQRVWSKSAAFAQGRHTLLWNGCDNLGRTAPAGVYLYRVTANGRTMDGKVLRVR
jgi:hypothetical protein